MPTKHRQRKLLLFFHGNAEDLGLAYSLLVYMRDYLKVNIMAVEYPGYGIYNELDMGHKSEGGPTEEKILSDARLVYDFVL